jgi:hypothetical protein
VPNSVSSLKLEAATAAQVVIWDCDQRSIHDNLEFAGTVLAISRLGACQLLHVRFLGDVRSLGVPCTDRPKYQRKTSKIVPLVLEAARQLATDQRTTPRFFIFQCTVSLPAHKLLHGTFCGWEVVPTLYVDEISTV